MGKGHINTGQFEDDMFKILIFSENFYFQDDHSR